MAYPSVSLAKLAQISEGVKYIIPLFYLDPPYWGCEGDYGKTLFAREDFEALATHLQGLRGKFLLSLNDHPEVRAIFAGFHMAGVETTWTSGTRQHGGGQRVGEVLIANFALSGAESS